MHTKHYFTAVLFCIFILLSGFKGMAQNELDTVRVEKKIFRYDYYYNDETLSFSQLESLLKNNKLAYKLLNQANTLRIVGYCFGLASGCSFGYSLGYAIGKSFNFEKMNMEIFLPFLGAGVVLTCISIGFDLGAKNKVKKGVAIFNHSIKQKNNTNINLGISTNGMLIKMNF